MPNSFTKLLQDLNSSELQLEELVFHIFQRLISVYFLKKVGKENFCLKSLDK